jgi:hypothetical protein
MADAGCGLWRLGELNRENRAIRNRRENRSVSGGIGENPVNFELNR